MDKPEPPLGTVARKIALSCAAFSCGIALLALLGWASGRLFVARLGLNYIPMAPSTALLCMLLDAALCVQLCWPGRRQGRQFAVATAVFVTALAGLILGCYLGGFDPELEYRWVQSTEFSPGVRSGQMSPITAAAFLLAGLALLALRRGTAAGRTRTSLSASAATLMAGLCLVVLLGYVYGTPLLYGGAVIPVALPTSVALLLLALGLLIAAGPAAWPSRLVAGASIRAQLLRAFLPTLLLLVAGQGLLQLVFLRHHINPALGVSLVALFDVVSVGGLIILIGQRLGGSLERAAEARRLAQEETRATLYGIGDGVIATDAASRVARMNPVAASLTGWSEAEALGRPIQEVFRIVNEDTRATVESPVECVLLEGQIVGLANHTLLIARDGTERPIADSGAPICSEAGEINGVVLVFRDQSAERAAQRALRESEEHYRLLFNSINDAVFLHGFSTDDAMPGYFLQVNDVACQRYGYTREEWLQMRPQDLDAPEGLAAIPRIMSQLQAQGHATWEGRHRTKDGRVIAVEISNVLFDYRGAPAILSAVRDITQRKETEFQVQESEERYRALFDRSLDAVYLHDLEGRFLDANPAALDALGYTREEIPSLRFSSLVTCEQDLARAYQSVKELVTTGTQKEVSEYLLRRKDGTLVWFELLGSLVLKDGKPIAIQGVGRNITGRKQAVEALRMTQFSVDHAADALYWMTADARIVSVNEAACRTLAYTREELLELGIPDIDPDISAAIWPDYWEKLKNHGNISFETRHRTKGGCIIPVEITASHIEFGGKEYSCAFVRDITERKRAEVALRESEERFRSYFELPLIGNAMTSPDKGWLEVNDYLCEILGYSREELMRMTWSQITHPADLPADLEQFNRVLAGQIDGYSMEKRFIRKDGRTIHANLSARCLRKANGEIDYFVVLLQDITERKRAEEERERLQEQLLQSQKMESVGRLAGGVAHDFNNMLGVIIGHAEMALSSLIPLAPLHDDLLQIQKAARRSADLTRQLLAFARKQTINPRVLDLNATVASMLKMLQRLIGENIELAWKPGPELWPVNMDPSQVDQMLANLSVNARDAIAGVGHLTIQTENVVFDDSYCRTHDGFAPGEYVLLAVSDTGAGMGPETLEHVFEPFFTTKAVGQGTGLGLAMVYGAVKQNQGFINVYSEPGQGTSFKIYLPRAGAAVAVAAEVQETPAQGSETVLLAEDEEAILNLGQTILTRHGYTVLAARTPAEALTLAERHGGPIHLLITDVVMPGMNGKQLKERLVVLRPGIKVLFMSGYTSDVIAHQGVIDEAVEFLQKPFSVNTLIRKVREVLNA